MPLLLAGVEVLHPHWHDALRLDARTWLVVHYAQIPLFALSAFGIALLVRGRNGVVAWICRAAAFVFGVSYVAFDTAAGVVTGILASAAQTSAAPETWRVPIETVWTHAIVGGAGASALGVLGAIALSVATLSAALVLRRSGGHSWGALILLAASGFGISIFQTHAWPGGPLTFGALGLAGAWIAWERYRNLGVTSLANVDKGT
ncbi:MAG: hypothetical protein QM741_17375 [Rudaea sp.]|uniref:hypothetical protein n=1 Tax=Rudaea sp. TaxID=2136325 RepID=UPI0039E32025